MYNFLHGKKPSGKIQLKAARYRRDDIIQTDFSEVASGAVNRTELVQE
jgi:hypothetical protein